MIARQGLYQFTPLKCVGLRYANRTSANAHFVALMKDLFGEHNYPRKHANHHDGSGQKNQFAFRIVGHGCSCSTTTTERTGQGL
jgi:hypothetical protein